MPNTYDFFVASLECPFCGSVCAADQSTNMSTYLRDQPEMANLTIGDRIRIDPQRVRTRNYEDNGYLTISAPKQAELIHILQPWECPNCGVFNWAEIVVRDDIIESISTVLLDPEHLERGHLISNDVISVVSKLTGEPVRDLLKRDLVPLLRERLRIPK